MAWLASPGAVDSVVLAALAHVHLASIHPFWDGNGRAARALSTLVLQRSDYGFRNLLSIDVPLLQDREGYFDALARAQGTRFQERYDATGWTKYFALALLQAER